MKVSELIRALKALPRGTELTVTFAATRRWNTGYLTQQYTCVAHRPFGESHTLHSTNGDRLPMGALINQIGRDTKHRKQIQILLKGLKVGDIAHFRRERGAVEYEITRVV